MPHQIIKRFKNRRILFNRVSSCSTSNPQQVRRVMSGPGKSTALNSDDLLSEAEAAESLDDIWSRTTTEGVFARHGVPTVPDLFTSPPLLRDSLVTETSASQDQTMEECLPFLTGIDESLGDSPPDGLPRLHRELHARFFEETLEPYPSSYTGLDASRPWMLYWALAGLSLLGKDVSPYRKRVIDTLRPVQNPDGGFGGGHGQMSHVAVGYASVLSLVMVGGEEAYHLIDRKALWRWLGTIKQPDGGFAVSFGAEVDVRGAYCSMVMLALLNLPLDLPPEAPARRAGMTSFLDKLPEWLSRCQTYEGGISESPGTEAHGAYAFCALACTCILGTPREMLPKCFNVPLLVSWLSARQFAPEGGFSGRTNKLVDACYSHWVGGCWPLVEAALKEDHGNEAPTERSSSSNLVHREGLMRYILACSQSPNGGFRDKPSKEPDGYHSCYALAGLSAVQHRSRHCSMAANPANGNGAHLGSPFGWQPIVQEHGTNSNGKARVEVCRPADLVRPVHPIFVISYEAAEAAHAWFGASNGF